MKYVIIGNSAAAIGCVEGIRSIDKKGEIIIISSESHHTYSRPLISYLLLGKTDRERMKYRPDSFYTDNNVTVMLGKTATSLDSKMKKITLDDKSVITYDKLLTATGSSPFIPPTEGMESVEKKFTFMTLDDALALEAALFPEARVLVVGAGLIGLKCVEGIAGKAGKITVLDLAPRILSSILTDDTASIVQNFIEKHGIEFILGKSVKRFNGSKAILSDDKELEFDILITAVGVRPNVSLIKDNGGYVGRGIITDKKQKTSLPDIYAAGDCCETYDITAEQNRILALLPNAYMEGECAGINMAGGNKLFDKAIPMNAIGFFGLHIASAGSYIGKVYEETGNGSAKKLFWDNNLLKGFILIGNIEKAGIYTSLIREKIPLDTINFELACKDPTLIAFSREYRNEKLGGAKK